MRTNFGNVYGSNFFYNGLPEITLTSALEMTDFSGTSLNLMRPSLRIFLRGEGDIFSKKIKK